MSAFLAWSNYADAGYIISDSAEPTLPASHLQNVHIAQIWRSQGAPSWLRSDLGSSHDVDVVALLGCNATDTSEIRVRIGDDPDFVTWAYDSGTLTDVCDPDFKAFIHILAAPATGRYVRIDMADAALAWFEAGRMFVSQGWRPRINYSFGAGRSYGSLSKQSQSRGGQIYIDVGPKYRRWSLTFSSLDDAEAEIVERIDRLNATDIDILLCAKEQSANLGRDSIFGTVEAPSEINNRAFRLHSKSYSIKERR